MDDKTLVFDTPEDIDFFRLAALRRALKLESVGMTSRKMPQTMLQIAREQYGVKAKTKKAAVVELDRLIEERIQAKRERVAAEAARNN